MWSPNTQSIYFINKRTDPVCRGLFLALNKLDNYNVRYFLKILDGEGHRLNWSRNIKTVLINHLNYFAKYFKT